VGRVLEIQTGAMGWLSGSISLLIGGFILATFLALFNYLTPSGRVTVTGRVVEVTPNVTGQIVAILVKPNVPVKADDVLFQIDPAPFQNEVTQLAAKWRDARKKHTSLDCAARFR
jgi:multidrug resistance efflux pump